MFGILRYEKRIEESGDYSGEDTPVPISNTEVKLLSADDTWRGTAWESRTLPVLKQATKHVTCFFIAMTQKKLEKTLQKLLTRECGCGNI